jgi:hypothetical protein
MKLLEKFILGIPYWFLKTILYAWLGAVIFWSWPPVVSGILTAIVLMSLLMMAWQRRAWEARIRREFHSGEARPFIDRPHKRRRSQVLNSVLVCIACGIIGWLLRGLANLNGLQWFLLSAGFMFASRDALIFGAPVTYIITDQVLAIRFVPGQTDHRLIFRFHEIRQAARITVPNNIPLRWQVLTPQRNLKEGVLMNVVRREGLSEQVQFELLLSPTDIEGFLRELGNHGIATRAVSARSDEETKPESMRAS